MAAVSDVAVWAQIFIYSGPQSAGADYLALGAVALPAPACLLFLFNAASVAIKTALLQRQITVFEAVQSTIAFLLAVSSVLFFEPNSGPIIQRVACLALSAASYWAAFASFRRAAEQRNFRVFVAWRGGLLLAGALWSLPLTCAAPCLGLTALAAVVLSVRQDCITLEFHDVIFLGAAALTSGLLEYAIRTLAGPLPGKPSWSIFLVAACAVLCDAAGNDRAGEAWQYQVLHFVSALLAASGVVAFMTQGLLRLAALAITTHAFQVASFRTLTVCSMALALAFGGSLWQRLEMTRIAYAALAFVAAKLLFEDLRHGRMEFIAASFFLFAVTLIGVPRLARMGHKTKGALGDARHRATGVGGEAAKNYADLPK